MSAHLVLPTIIVQVFGFLCAQQSPYCTRWKKLEKLDGPVPRVLVWQGLWADLGGDQVKEIGQSETRSRLPSKEIAQQGRALYERAIRHQLEADHHGEVVAIDVSSERWAVAGDPMEAVGLLREIEPDAVNILCERVGYRGLSSFGAGSLERPR